MAKPAVKPKIESLPISSKSPAKSPGPGDNSVSAEQLKKFYREHGQIRLQPANEKYEPIIVKEVKIQGVVVGVVRKYG